MDVTPRLAVTREQCDPVEAVAFGLIDPPVTLRLPERPTMSCPECGGYATDRWRCDGVEVAVVCNYCNGGGAVPIPEGTRVEVVYRDVVTRDDWPEYPDVRRHPVAFATLAEVHAALADGQPYRWYVTLSDIKPVEADQ